MVCAVRMFSCSTTSFKSLNVKAFSSQHLFRPSNFFISLENSVEVLMSSQTVFGNPENIMMSRTSSMLYSNENLCKWRSVGRCCKNPSFVTENKSKKRSNQIWNKYINLGHYVLRLETMLWFLLILTILFRSDGFLAPNDFSDYLTLQSFNYHGTDKNYSRNVSCTLNSIFTYLCLYLYIIFKWFIGFIKEL